MIEFNKDKHEYKVDGVVLPSVSQIMQPLSQQYYSKIPEKIMEQARNRGSKVHEAIDDYITFGIFNEEYKLYVQQFVLFMQNQGWTIVGNELMFTNNEYCGTLDLLMVDENGDYHVVDIKVTSKINQKLLEVQLYAYKNLVETTGKVIKSCQVLWLQKDKYSFKTIPLNKEKWEELHEEFKNKGNINKPKSKTKSKRKR